MRRFLPWIIGAIVIIGIYSWVKGINNTAVTLNQNIEESWGNVQTSYQRRNDLIGNLVNTVKGYAEHEKSTLTAVIEARAKATQMNVNANDLTPEKLKEFQAAQGQLSQAMGRLMVVSEQYPTLQANKNFQDLQVQLESTENRITVARNDYNESVKEFNIGVRKFPMNLIAGLFKMSTKPTFEADAASQKAPSVQF